LTRLIQAVVALALTAVIGCGAPQPGVPAQQPGDDITLTIVGFNAGGSTQLRADAMAEAIRLEQPGWKVVSMAAGGEARLASKRLAGEADLYFPPGPRALELAGQLPLHPGVDYASLTDYRLVMPSAQLWLHLLADEDTGFTQPSDLVLRRQPYAVGCGAGTMTLVLSSMFEYHGSSLAEAADWGFEMKPIVISSPEGVEALESGSIDAGLGWAGIPSSHFLGITSGVRLLPIAEPALLRMFADLDCVPAVIPAGTYPFMKDDVPTVAALQPLVSRTDMPDDVVYEVVRALFTHADLIVAAYGESARYMTPEAVIEAVALSEQTGELFHAGALRYYRDRGWID